MVKLEDLKVAQKFSELFDNSRCKKKLEIIASSKHTKGLPTFSLTTTSLRYLNRWIDRLSEIDEGKTLSGPHGNYYSDPASIGLVDHDSTPPKLTEAGVTFLTKKPDIYNSRRKAEYELIKTMYFSDYSHNKHTRAFISKKYKNAITVFRQFLHTRNSNLFRTQPRLLVIAEYIHSFPEALRKLQDFSAEELDELVNLGEEGFKNLCPETNFHPGLTILCGRIGGEYTRAEDRRLHQLISLSLLSTSKGLQTDSEVELVIPYPFSNLFSEKDIFQLYAEYTSDIQIWFDGSTFKIRSFLNEDTEVTEEIQIQNVSLDPLTSLPKGRGHAPSRDPGRRKKKTNPGVINFIPRDSATSERSEDYVEQNVLIEEYGESLERMGHRVGENLSLDDGLVPGADFYVLNNTGDPQEFIEVKSISNDLPVDISLTRAEYLRAKKCAEGNIPYQLILFDIRNNNLYRNKNFADEIESLDLSNTSQFRIRIK